MVFLKILQNSQESTCARVSFLIKLQLPALFKKRLWHRCFPVNFAKFLRTLFQQNTFGRLLLNLWLSTLCLVVFTSFKYMCFRFRISLFKGNIESRRLLLTLCVLSRPGKIWGGSALVHFFCSSIWLVFSYNFISLCN